MGKIATDETREKQMAEDTWLNYFNRYLYKNGTITEREYKKMTEKIATRNSTRSRERDAR